jgi:hypothetical protein
VWDVRGDEEGEKMKWKGRDGRREREECENWLESGSGCFDGLFEAVTRIAVRAKRVHKSRQKKAGEKSTPSLASRKEGKKERRKERNKKKIQLA